MTLCRMDEDSVAELKQVAWLEVTGSTPKDVVIGKEYKVGFRVSLRPDAFGWEGREVYIMAKIGKRGTVSFKKVNFEGKSQGMPLPFDIPEDKLVITVTPKETAVPSDDCKLYFGMYEVWSKMWKGGLKIHHAFVVMVDE
ncbi:protein PHLOEM PROTEIN 2-LIKE A9-like isoform X2 [Momordica charantia]|nr:protein PHLOEM PROTEIN 2-LIKE A9-like isoform X2 [Momordica charantia]